MRLFELALALMLYGLIVYVPFCLYVALIVMSSAQVMNCVCKIVIYICLVLCKDVTFRCLIHRLHLCVWLIAPHVVFNVSNESSFRTFNRVRVSIIGLPMKLFALMNPSTSKSKFV